MLLLLVDPELEFPDGFTLYRQLDVGISGVHPRSCGVAHERHANFLHDTGLHQAGIKGVAKVVKADVSNRSSSERGLPRAFYDADRSAFVFKDQSLLLAALKQMLQQAPGQGNFP